MNQEDPPLFVCMHGPGDAQRPAGRADRLVSLLLRACILFALWVILSGFLDAFHLTLGAAASLFVAWLSHDLWPPEGRLFRKPAMFLRLAGYVCWLFTQIVKANWHVLKLALHPRPTSVIDPRLVRFKSAMRSKLGLTILANSMTLTPGTISVYVDERGWFTVHALDAELAAGVPGDMEARLVAIFGGGNV